MAWVRKYLMMVLSVPAHTLCIYFIIYVFYILMFYLLRKINFSMWPSFLQVAQKHSKTSKRFSTTKWDSFTPKELIHLCQSKLIAHAFYIMWETFSFFQNNIQMLQMVFFCLLFLKVHYYPSKLYNWNACNSLLPKWG